MWASKRKGRLERERELIYESLHPCSDKRNVGAPQMWRSSFKDTRLRIVAENCDLTSPFYVSLVTNPSRSIIISMFPWLHSLHLTCICLSSWLDWRVWAIYGLSYHWVLSEMFSRLLPSCSHLSKLYCLETGWNLRGKVMVVVIVVLKVPFVRVKGSWMLLINLWYSSCKEETRG